MHVLVPQFILRQYREGNQYGALQAACLFADLSGFSAMTSSLMQVGQYGAEIVAGIMRELFTPMIESVYQHQGFVTNFAGDAITALFPLDGDGHQSLRHAIAAATEIQELIHAYPAPQTPVGSFSISVRIGISSGEANWGIISSGDHQRATYYFRGSAIDACNESQMLARKGEIVLDPTTCEMLSPVLETEPIADHFILKSVHAPLPPAGPIPETEIDLENATRFYPKSILTQNLMGEFRYVVNMFISLPTVRTEPQLEIFLKTFFSLQDKFGGLLNRIDFGDKGAHMLLFWGAPISYENDIGRALNFILSLQTETSIPINAGVTYRIAHAGFIGSSLREEYTCYGQGVNLAARFMTTAPRGEVWVDESIATRIGQYFEIEPGGEFYFKGFEEKQKVFTLFERRQNVALPVSGTFFGREKELAQLVKFAQPLANHQFPQPVVIAGEPGIGKSRLIHELLTNAAFPVEDFLIARCQTDQMLRRSFNPFRYWAKSNFEVLDSNADARNKRNFNRRMDQLIGQTGDPDLAAELDRTRSFLGSLVNLSWDDSLYEQLDPQGRYENTIIGLVSLIKAESLLHPVILFIEDLQWIDSDSKVLLQQLYRSANQPDSEQYPIFIIATNRDLAEDDSLGEDVPYETITLSPFDAKGIRNIAANFLNGAKITPEFGDILVRYSEGNPLFTEQIIRYLQEENQLVETENGLALKEESTAVLPGDTRALLVARLDQIQPEVKHVILTAATVGREFDTRIVSYMLGQDSQLDDKLRQAQQGAIWTPINLTTYAFNSNLFRDTAYRIQTRAQRQTHHQNAFAAFEEVHRDDLSSFYPELAYHAEKATLSEKACTYYTLAGKAAQGEYQNRQAIYYFTKAITLATEIGAEEDLADLLLLREDTFNLLGDRASQTQDLQQAEALAKKRDNPVLIAKVFNRQARLHYLLGEYQESIQLVKRSISLSQESQKPSLEVEARIFWANSSRQMGEYSTAIEQVTRGLELAQQNNDENAVGTCINVLSLATIELGDFPRAIDLLNESLKNSKANQNYSLEAQTLNNLGNVYGEIGDFSSAYQAYTQAQEISRQIGSRQGEGLTTANLGWVAGQLGDYPAATSHLEKSIRIAQEIGHNYLQAFSLLNLSLFTCSQNEPELAKTYALEGLDMLQKTGHKPGEAVALTYLGHAFLQLEQYDDARENYQKALEIRTALTQENLSMEPLAGLAEIQLAVGGPASAISQSKKILAFLEKGGSLDGIDQPFRIYTICAKILLENDDPNGEDFLFNAHALLQEKAGKIKDKKSQASFLSNVPCHLELIEMVQRTTKKENSPPPPSKRP